MKRDHALNIQTPEGVLFSYPLSGPASRAVALLLDIFCISVMNTLIGYVVSLFQIFSEDLYIALSIIVFFVTNIFYGIFMEYFYNGQTIGKKVMSLRVMDAEGLQLTGAQIIIRNLLRVIDLLPGIYLLGGIISSLTKKSFFL